MLQTMRNNLKGAVAYILVGLITVVFALFGADALFMGGLAQDTEAEVNGHKVTRYDVLRGMEQQKNQLRNMFGEDLDPRMLEESFLRPSVMESLIQKKILVSAAKESGLRISKKELDREIVADETFHSDGTFNKDYYKSILRQYGFTPSSYRNELAESRLVTQYRDVFAETFFVTDEEILQLARLQHESRSFAYLTLPLSEAMAAIVPGDDELQNYYQQYREQFMLPAQAAVQYILLDKTKLSDAVVISEEDIVAQYEAELAELDSKKERHAAHILIEEQADGSHLDLLGDIQQQLQQGADFAALAAEHSADSGSAQQGGDVGITSGDSFVEEFEQALQKLSVGEISEPVKTQFGYHIIKLLDEKEATVPTLDESRDRISEILQVTVADELYAEKLELLSEAAADLGGESSSLSSVASLLTDEDLTIAVEETGLFSRQDPAALFTANPVLTSPLIINAVFAEGVQAGSVTDVMELDEDHAVLIQVSEYQAAALQPLDDVVEMVSEAFKREKAEQQTALEINKLLQRVLADEPLKAIAGSEKLAFERFNNKSREDGEIDQVILKKAFSIPPPAEKNSIAADTVQLANGDWVLIRVLESRVPAADEITEEQREQLAKRLRSRVGNQEFNALMNMLTAEADIARRSQALTQ